MAAPNVDSPQQLLQVLKEWRHEAADFIYSVNEWRRQQTYGYGWSPEFLKDKTAEECQKLVPLPRPFPVLERHTKPIIEWLESEHGIDTIGTRSFQVIADAAQSWNREKNADNVPEYRVLDLELKIARILTHRAAFPLLASLSYSPEQLNNRVLGNFIKYSIEIQDKGSNLIREWPSKSDERWRYRIAVCTKNIADVSQTPLSLAIAEADGNGRLSFLIEPLRALDNAIKDFAAEFYWWPQGNRIPDSSIGIFNPVNELALFLGKRPLPERTGNNESDVKLSIEYTVREAARISGTNPGIISRAAGKGELINNGLRGRARRIAAAGLTEWMHKRAERPEAQESPEQVKRLMKKHVKS